MLISEYQVPALVFFGGVHIFIHQCTTRNTLTQASKNGRKPYLFPQKKFASVFYAINIFNTIYYDKPTNFNYA